MTWTDFQPELGDSAVLTRYAASLRSSADDVHGTQTSVMELSASAQAAWRGTAGAAYLAALDAVRARCGVYVAWVDQYAAAIDQHATTVAAIIAEATTARSLLAGATDDEANKVADQNRLTALRGQLDQGPTGGPDQLERMIAAAWQATQTARAAQQVQRDAIADCARRRHAAEAAFAEAISVTTSLSPAETHALAACGIRYTAETDPMDAAILMADFALKNPNRWNGAAEYLESIAGNSALESAFWLYLGGDAAADLMQRMRASSDEGAASVETQIARIRDSFAEGSQGWSTGEAAYFARALLLGKSENPDANIAWLFAGPPSPGAQISGLMARRAIDWERRNGRTTLLAQLPDGSVEHIRIDPTAIFLTAVGQYPDQACALMSDQSDEDLRYLHETRNWALDQHEGITTFLRGAQLGAGDATDISAGDADRARAFARKVSTALDALVHNRGFTTDNIGDAASISLAVAYLHYQPGYTQQLASTSPGANVGTSQDCGVGRANTLFITPDVSVTTLSVILGAIGVHGAGANVLVKPVEAYAQSLRAEAAGMNPSDPDFKTGYAALLATANAAEGSVAGAVAGTRIYDAEAQDQQASGVRDNLTKLFTGLALIPGYKWVESAAVTIGGYSATTFGWGPDAGAEAVRSAQVSEASGTVQFEFRTLSAVWTMAGGSSTNFKDASTGTVVSVPDPAAILAATVSPADIQKAMAEWNNEYRDTVNNSLNGILSSTLGGATNNWRNSYVNAQDAISSEPSAR